MDYNEYTQQINEQPSFKVHGQDVTIISPTAARITIHCPWSTNEAATAEHQSFVMKYTQCVINYMLAEDILKNNGSGVGIIVETEHHPIQ